jgi:hypothetical protein
MQWHALASRFFVDEDDAMDYAIANQRDRRRLGNGVSRSYTPRRAIAGLSRQVSSGKARVSRGGP